MGTPAAASARPTSSRRPRSGAATLVPRANHQRIHARGHRLHALARQRRHQPRAVTAQPRVPVGVSLAFTEMSDVAFEFSQVFHQGSPFARRSANHAVINTVKIGDCRATVGLADRRLQVGRSASLLPTQLFENTGFLSDSHGYGPANSAKNVLAGAKFLFDAPGPTGSWT